MTTLTYYPGESKEYTFKEIIDYLNNGGAKLATPSGVFQTASLYMCTEVSNNADGANNDIVIRVDGSSRSFIYRKTAGVLPAIV